MEQVLEGLQFWSCDLDRKDWRRWSTLTEGLRSFVLRPTRVVAILASGVPEEEPALCAAVRAIRATMRLAENQARLLVAVAHPTPALGAALRAAGATEMVMIEEGSRTARPLSAMARRLDGNLCPALGAGRLEGESLSLCEHGLVRRSLGSHELVRWCLGDHESCPHWQGTPIH